MKIAGTSSLDAWKKVARHLCDQKAAEDFNILVTFPVSTVNVDNELEDYSPRLFGLKFDRITDVANTIFPLQTSKNSPSRDHFYKRYEKAHRRSRNRRWGTYFLRFIAFGKTRENQLENVIHALNTWKVIPKAGLLMHVSSADTDRLRLMGGPCLQYVQFNRTSDDQLHLVAVYRNHDFFNKALGNYVGLERLLKYVCEQSGRIPSTITCFSIHAFSDASKEFLQSLAKVDA